MGADVRQFNTFEGGAIICQTAEMKQHIDELKNFGIVDEITIKIPGSNGKMSEIHAALGLAQLGHIDACIARRGEIDAAYRAALTDVPGLDPLPKLNQSVSNYAYFPLLVNEDYPLDRDGIYDRLRESNILTRRYFYPLLSSLPMYAHLPSADSANLPVAIELAQRVLCLPIFPAMGDDDVARIVDALRYPLNNSPPPG